MKCSLVLCSCLHGFERKVNALFNYIHVYIYMYIQYVIRKFFKENWLGKMHRSILRNLRSSLIVVHFFSPPPIIDFHWNFLLRPNKFLIAMYIFWDSIQIFNNNKKKEKKRTRESSRNFSFLSSSFFTPISFTFQFAFESRTRNIKRENWREPIPRCIDPISY